MTNSAEGMTGSLWYERIVFLSQTHLRSALFTRSDEGYFEQYKILNGVAQRDSPKSAQGKRPAGAPPWVREQQVFPSPEGATPRHTDHHAAGIGVARLFAVRRTWNAVPSHAKPTPFDDSGRVTLMTHGVPRLATQHAGVYVTIGPDSRPPWLFRDVHKCVDRHSRYNPAHAEQCPVSLGHGAGSTVGTSVVLRSCGNFW